MSEEAGYAGKILKVDLSCGKIINVPISDYASRFLGGRGIAAKIYWDEAPPQIDCFDPTNRLIFVTGPITAVTGFAGSRWQVCGRGPDHNQFSYCNLGGGWGAWLKMAGYDGLVVYGKADAPVYLWITDDGVELRSASHLWGKGAISCREELKAQLGQSVRVVAIGPAGENLVTFSTLLADNDASGRGGLAAVMGSKNIKAIAIKGSRKLKVADPKRVREIKQRVIAMCGEQPDLVESFPYLRAVPRERLKKAVCYGCTVFKGYGTCQRRMYTAQSGQKGKWGCGAAFFYIGRAMKYYGEYNDVGFEATKFCDDYGLDTYAIETMIKWLDNCYKAGILSEEETGVPFSKLGSREYIECLTRKIAYREGIGDVLAKGSRRAAETIGSKAQKLITDYISKTHYLPVYGARMYLTTGLFYAMESKLPIQQLHEVMAPVMNWAAQVQGMANTGVTSEVVRGIAKRFWGSEVAGDFSTYEGKALAAAKIQDRQFAKESLILCDFTWPILFSKISEDGVGDPTLESQLCSAVTGRNIDEQDLYKIGERVFNLQRAILTRERGKGREYDSLEEFNFTSPIKTDTGNPDCLVPGKDGETFSRKGMVVDREKFEQMKTEYYQIRGWDPATGLQKKRKLEELELADIASEMDKLGLLA